MTKEEMLNGMSEQEFYDRYPTQEDWANAQQMKLGGLSGAPHNGQPTADEFFSYGSHYNDSVNVPMGNPYYAAEGGTPYYGGPTRPYAYGGGLPGGANEYDMPCMNCGGYMEQGGDYNSPTNYGSFNVPMQVGGINPEMKTFLEQRNASNIKNIPSRVRDYTAENNDLSRIYPNKDKFDLRVEGQRFPTDSVVNIPNNPQIQAAYRNGKFTIAGSTPAGIKQAAAINAGNLKQGKDKMIYADYSDLYKEDGGILDASNNMSYPTFEDGGKYNLLNLIKAASKKMKKAYGGDTVTQGGNSGNYPSDRTKQFLNSISNLTTNAIMNEEQDVVSDVIKQMGGYAGGYNQEPQFNKQNQAMQSMYQQRIDDTQSNLKNDFSNFGQSINYLGATANPYTKTSVSYAADGIQTGPRNMSPEEWEWMDEQRKAKQNEANYARYFGSQGTRGMNYIPMNYNQLNKISKKDVGIMKQLADNPSTNLKEFSHRHFGPWSKTKMTFDYNKPYDNSKITLNDGPDKTNALNNTTPNKTNTSNTSSAAGSLPSAFALRPGVAVDNIYTPHGQTLNLPNSPMRQGPTQGAETRAEATQGQTPWYIPTHGQFPLQNAAFDPNAAGPGHRYGGGSGYYQTGGNPIQIPESLRFVPQMAQEGEGDDVVVPGAPKPDGFNPDQVIENKPFVPGYQNKSTATITQKGRPGFNGEAMANALIAGTNMASSFLEAGQNAKNEKKLGELKLADNAFVSTPVNAASQGDYDQWGNFRPNKKDTGTRDVAYGGSIYQDGGMQQQQPDPQQVMQGVATMLQQGAKPEQVAKQLVEMGIPQEQVIQIIQAVMQQLQGGQEEPQQQPMRYGGFATGGAAEEESYEEDLNEDEIAELRAQGYDVEYI
jgi:hypothetical protein